MILFILVYFADVDPSRIRSALWTSLEESYFMLEIISFYLDPLDSSINSSFMDPVTEGHKKNTKFKVESLI